MPPRCTPPRRTPLLAHPRATPLAALLVLALALGMPRPAHAVQFAAFGTTCIAGDSAGSFIELRGFDTESMRVPVTYMRVFDRSGQVRFEGDAYGGKGSQYFQWDAIGRRFLWLTDEANRTLYDVAPPPFTFADALLPFALDPVAGRLVLFRLGAGGETIIDQVAYGTASVPAPPPGGSMLRLSTTRWTLQFETRLHAFTHGTAGSPLACLTSPQYFTSAAMFACEDGETRGQHLQITGLGLTGAWSEHLDLVIHDRRDSVLTRISDLFGPGRAPGSRLPTTWLLAGPAFATTSPDSADFRLPVELDPAGGRIELVMRVGAFTKLVDNFTYGSGGIALPPLGLSYWRPDGTAAVTRLPDPVNSRDVHLALPECGLGTGTARLALSELALSCTDGRPQGQFIELTARGGMLEVDHGYHMRCFRSDGTLAFEERDVFAEANDSTSLGGGLTWLMIPGADPRKLYADHALADTLDRTAGAIEFWHQAGAADSLVLRFEWGAPPLALPPSGGSLGFASGGYERVAYPTPRAWSGAVPPHDDCVADRDPVTVTVHAMGLDCSDGSRSAAYVELEGLTPELVRDTRLGLRLLAADGHELTRVEPLFPARAEWPLDATRHWLVAGPGFEVRTGLAPDVTWVVPLVRDPILVQFYRGDPVTQSLTPISAHAVQPALLRPGRAEVRTPSGTYESASVVSPTRFDGAHAASGACWSLPHPEAVRLSALFLRCRAGDPSVQYVELAAEGTESMYSAELVLRVSDHAGQLLGERRAPFPSEYRDRAWPLGRSLLIGSAGFAAAVGVAPDAVLPAALDTVGGRIELLLAPGGTQELLLDALVYGKDGVPTPPGGAALVAANGRWRAESLPRASGIALAVAAPTACLGECPGRTVRFAFGGERAVTRTSGEELDTGASFRFDGSSGDFALTSTFRELGVRWDDRYVVEGVAPGTPLEFSVRVRHHLASDDTCLARGCIASLASIRISQGGLSDSIAASLPSRALLLPVHARAGEAFDVGLALRADAVPSPLLTASVEAQLDFMGLPEGARVRSCSGFDSRSQRGIGTPVVSTAPRRIEVRWPVTGRASAIWTIERRVDAGAWSPFETRTADADGWLRVSDVRVSTGHTYAYRTGWSDPYGDYASIEATAEAPAQPGYAFDGVFPNPSSGSIDARLQIPEAGIVRLEVLDITGRVVASRSRWLEAGTHTQSLTRDRALAPGVYTVRLRYGQTTSWGRVVVLR